MSQSPIRILHCPFNTAGNPLGLARAEREIGLSSWCVSFNHHPFGYDSDEVLWPNGYHPLKSEIKRWQLFWRACKYFDLIHFNFGISILPSRKISGLVYGNPDEKLKYRLYNVYARFFELMDLPILKALNKGIVVTYQGDDARQGDYCLKNFTISPVKNVEKGYYYPASDTIKRQRIKIFDKYADAIYALNPDLLNILPKRAKFLPYAHIDITEWIKSPDVIKNRSHYHILHAPSHRGVKGTDIILQCIEKLKKENYHFDFTLVENFPHKRIRDLFLDADILIDQLFCGWYGGISVEFMALGKPVMCYIRQSDTKFLPDQMVNNLPIINVSPHTIYEKLKLVLDGKTYHMESLKSQSRKYVEKYHDPIQIARTLKKDYSRILANRYR